MPRPKPRRSPCYRWGAEVPITRQFVDYDDGIRLNDWSFDITRQGAWDVWCWVCIAASAVLLAALLPLQVERARRSWPSLILITAGLVGTALVLSIRSLRNARTGMVWTFLLLAIVSAVFYLRLLSRLGGGKFGALLALRILALACLVPMLFEPVVRYISTPEPERPVLFVIDTSGSMSFPDIQNGPTRLQSIWQALQPLLPRIRQKLVPQFFTFSTDLAALKKPDDLAKLPADGKATDISLAVSKAWNHATRDDAAVVLLSDGIDNTTPNVAETLAAQGRPVYTVLVGSDAAEAAQLANIAVADVESDEDWAVGHETTITATIKSSALLNRVVDVNLAEVDASGKALGPSTTQKLVLQPSADGQKVKLTYKPESVGVHRLAVWVDPVAGERSVVDNRQELQGLAIDPSVKVLYIEGRLRPEYKDLKRLLEHDPNIELATLLRIQQTRFVAFGTVDRKPMPPQIPQTPEAWKRFDVVILGDLDASFLAQPEQAQLEQFVTGGGALLMLGGEKSFGPGGYRGTPIERALPVFVGDLSSPQDTDKFIPRLTPEGATHPAMEGLAPWFGTGAKPGEKPLPELYGNIVVGAEKSGAQVLLTHPGKVGPDGKPQIVLAVQRYGKGRSGALTLHSTYQWALPLYGLGQDSPYNRLWAQLIRWLAGADVRNRQRGAGVEALLNKSVFALGESVRVRAMVRDEHGDATQFAQVTLALQEPGAKQPRTLSLAPVEAHAGLYDLVIPHPPKGDYTATLIATRDGKTLGRRELKFTVIPSADELLKIAANPTLLRQIAADTHGSFYELGRLPDLIDELIRTDTRTPKSQQVVIRLANFPYTLAALIGRHPDLPRKYDLPIQALLVVPLLGVEWVLRRRWQIA